MMINFVLWCTAILFFTAVTGFRCCAKDRNCPPSNIFTLQSTAKSSIDQTYTPEMERETLRTHLLTAIDQYREVVVATPANHAVDVPFTVEEKHIIAMIEQVVKFNPTPVCNIGWKGHGTTVSAGVAGGFENVGNSLNGVWKLRFTSSVDGLFSYGRRGPQTITQMVNITQGTLTNVVEFKQHPGKVKGYRVIYEGIPVNDRSLQLKVQKLVVDRRSRFKLAWFNTVQVPLGRFLVSPFLQKRIKRPSQDNRWLTDENALQEKDVSLQLETLYLDDEMRVHVTEDGNYHVHTRVYDAWDPMLGWTMVSAV